MSEVSTSDSFDVEKDVVHGPPSSALAKLDSSNEVSEGFEDLEEGGKGLGELKAEEEQAKKGEEETDGMFG